MGARGQAEGDVVQGIGYALTENLRTNDKGVIVNGNFHDYRLPTIVDVPPNIGRFSSIPTRHRTAVRSKGLG